MTRFRRALAAIPKYVPGKSAELVAREHELEHAIKLASNEAPFGPLPAALAAAAAAAAGANRYPDDGCVDLRDALAARYGLAAEEVLLGNGSVTLCQQAFFATIEPGDEALFAWPSFEAYPIQAQQADATMVRVPFRDHRYDLDAMAEHVTDRTRLVFVCTPNNPTGGVVYRDELERFLARVPPDCLVVLDEAYHEFVDDPAVPDGLDVLRDHENVAVYRTFSKAYGLAALRVGYAMARPDVIDALRKVKAPFDVNAVAQAAALASLGAESEMRARVAEVVKERKRVAPELLALGYPVAPSQANFLWLDLPEQALALGAFAEHDGVVLRTFADVGARVTIGTPIENDRMLEVLAAAAAEGVIAR